MSTLAIAALMLAVVLASQYLVGPLAVWRSPMHRTRVDFPAHDWRETVFGCGPGMLALHERLVALGYAPCAASTMDTTHAGARFVVYRHADGSLALAMHMTATVGTFDYVEFSVQLAGDVSLTLSNALLPSIYPRWERQRAYRLSGATDIEDLYARFQRLRARQDLIETPIAEGRELVRIGDWINDQHDWLLAKGYLRRGTDATRLYLSLPAAFRASYRMLWPLKSRLVAADRRAALLATAL